jgi:hypothetical protein
LRDRVSDVEPTAGRAFLARFGAERFYRRRFLRLVSGIAIISILAATPRTPRRLASEAASEQLSPRSTGRDGREGDKAP